MKRRTALGRDWRVAGVMLPELLISTALTSIIAAGMLITITALQKSAAASQHHAASQLNQARILDYIARDLRRALTVAVDTTGGVQRLNLTIPDYYDADGKPRDPTISGESATYGAPGASIPISYYRRSTAFYRNVNGIEKVLAWDVADFDSNFTDTGGQTISVTITFRPRYRFGSNTASSIEIGTAASNTTLLRNKRQ